MPSLPILPPRERLDVGAEDVLELVYLLRSTASPLDRLRSLVAGLGGELRWACKADALFVGDGPLHWTHLAIARFPSARAVLEAASSAPTIEADDLQLFRLIPRELPWLVQIFLGLLRPIGLLLEPSDEWLENADLDIGEEPGVNPTRAQIQERAHDARGVTSHFLNLLAYRDRAEVGGVKSSGRAAYHRYGQVAARSVYLLGGNLIAFGRLVGPLIEGAVNATSGEWDELAIMQYPTPRTVLKLEQMPGYRAALADRSGGLDRTVVIVAIEETPASG